jgi:hypothetical protein
MEKLDWSKEARSIVKAAIVRRGLTYEQIVEKLRSIGVDESVSGVKGKIHRGTFSFAFVLQIMKALDKTNIDIG